MKINPVNRINILIPANINQHKKFLYNEVLDFAQREKLGGVYSNEYIKINTMPENLLEVLKKLKIKFTKL